MRHGMLGANVHCSTFRASGLSASPCASSPAQLPWSGPQILLWAILGRGPALGKWCAIRKKMLSPPCPSPRSLSFFPCLYISPACTKFCVFFCPPLAHTTGLPPVSLMHMLERVLMTHTGIVVVFLCLLRCCQPCVSGLEVLSAASIIKS